MHKLRVAETHFDFRRMHVDVNFVIWHFEEKQCSGKGRRRKNIAISFVDRVENHAIAHQSAIHEDVNTVAIRALNLWSRGKSGHGKR